MSQVPPPMATPPMGYQTPGPQKPQGMAVAALVCGIISIISFCFWPLSIPLGIVAIVLGIMAKGKVQRGEAGGEGLAKTGLILGSVGIALALLIVILAMAGMSFLHKNAPQWQQQIEQKAQELEQQANDAAAESGTVTPTTEPSP